MKKAAAKIPLYLLIIMVVFVFGSWTQKVYSYLPFNSEKSIEHVNNDSLFTKNKNLYKDIQGVNYEYLQNKLNNIESNWLSAIGVVLSFTGLILALFNLSIFLSFWQAKEELKKNLEDANNEQSLNLKKTEDLYDNYVKLSTDSIPQNLVISFYNTFRKIRHREMLSQGRRYAEMQIKGANIDSLVLFLMLIYDSSIKNREFCLRELFKIEKLFIVDLKKAILENGEMTVEFKDILKSIEELLSMDQERAESNLYYK